MQVLRDVGAGEMIGETQFLETGNRGSIAEFIAVTKVECLVVSLESIEVMYSFHPLEGARFFRNRESPLLLWCLVTFVLNKFAFTLFLFCSGDVLCNALCQAIQPSGEVHERCVAAEKGRGLTLVGESGLTMRLVMTDEEALTQHLGDTYLNAGDRMLQAMLGYSSRGRNAPGDAEESFWHWSQGLRTADW